MKNVLGVCLALALALVCTGMATAAEPTHAVGMEAAGQASAPADVGVRFELVMVESTAILGGAEPRTSVPTSESPAYVSYAMLYAPSESEVSLGSGSILRC